MLCRKQFYLLSAKITRGIFCFVGLIYVRQLNNGSFVIQRPLSTHLSPKKIDSRKFKKMLSIMQLFRMQKHNDCYGGLC